MISNERRVIEIAAGVLFIVLLLLFVFLIISVAESNKVVITDSYNTYNIYSSPHTIPLSGAKPYIIDEGTYAKTYYLDEGKRYTDYYSKPLRYDYWGELRTVNGIFGPIDKYEVYVTNKDYIGGWFKVRYYFEDYYGRTKTEYVSYYLEPQEQKLFLFRDISPSNYKYRSWRYEVIPQTDAPVKVYYNYQWCSNAQKYLKTNHLLKKQQKRGW